MTHTEMIKPYPVACVLQATVRAPAARNMITKTLPMMYLIGTIPFLLISFIGYWAYGNEVGYNILYSSSGPTWAIALAYVASAVQIIVSFHVSFCHTLLPTQLSDTRSVST